MRCILFFFSNMVLALKELSIRANFRTTVEYLINLLERKEFIANDFNTAWLDSLIEMKVKVLRITLSKIAITQHYD